MHRALERWALEYKDKFGERQVHLGYAPGEREFLSRMGADIGRISYLTVLCFFLHDNRCSKWAATTEEMAMYAADILKGRPP